MKPEKTRGLATARRRIRSFLDREDAAREKGLKACREIIRCAGSAIQSIHRERHEEARKRIDEGLSLLAETRKNLESYPEIRYAGFLHSAEKEIIEALTTFSVITEHSFPDMGKYEFDPVSYLHGIAESVGELRRHLLDGLRRGKIGEAESFLETMDEIYYFLVSFDYPHAITRSLRRQVDYVRSMLERTRSDVTLAVLRREPGT